MVDVRAHREAFRFQAGSAATITVTAASDGDPVDLTAHTLTLTPQGGDPIVATTTDPEVGTRVFSFTASNTSVLDEAGKGTISLADGDGNEWVVGSAWASTAGTTAQDHQVAVTLGQANIAVTVAAYIGSGGGGGLPSGGNAGQVPVVTEDGVGWLSPNSPNGYARLDGDGTIPDNRIPSSIARDSEVTSALAGKENVGVAQGLIDELLPEVFRAALHIGLDISDLDGTVDGDVATIPALEGAVPAGLNVLLTGQDNPAHDGMYVSDGTDEFTRTAEARQPLKVENAGLIVSINTDLSTLEPLRAVVRSDDGVDVYLDPLASGDGVDLPLPLDQVDGLEDALAAKADASALTGKLDTAKAPLYLSDYADNTGATSASAGMKAALDALGAQGGGELVIDGTFLLDTAAAVKSFTTANSVTIRGYGSRSVLICRGGVNNVCLQLGTIDSLTIENVTFFGSQSTSPDVRCALYLAECRTATLQGCNFIGIVAGSNSSANNGGVLRAHATNLVLRSTNFLGCGGQIAAWHGGDDVAVVACTLSNGFTAEDCRWHDVIIGAHFRGTSQAFKRQPIAWVWIKEPQLASGTWVPTHSRQIEFRNCQLDEAIACGIRVDNPGTTNTARHRLVKIENTNVASPSDSTSPYALAAPILIKGTDTVVIRDVAVGYFGTVANAVQFEDCDDITVDGLYGWAPATTLVADEDCGTLRYRNLRGSISTVESDAAETVDLDNSSGGGAVDSVNGKTGTVTLDSADVQAAPRQVVATGADYSLQADYGTPSVRMDGTQTNDIAMNAGNMYVAHGGLTTTTDLTRVIFETTASSLSAGQSVNVVCYEVAANGLPGELYWSQSVTVGTTVGVIGTNVSGLDLPGGGYFIGIHNPSGNAGSVTLKMGRPIDTPFRGLGSLSLWSAIHAAPGASPPADMSTFAVNSAANSTTRLAPLQTAPIILVR